MRSRPLSASSMKTFLQCVLKYYFSYEDKKPRINKSDPLSFGSAVHESLELMHNLAINSGKELTEEENAQVMQKFMSVAVSGGLESLPLYDEGRDMVKSRLDNLNINDKVIGTEISFSLTTPNGTPFLGHIDKLVELDATTVAVVDYKTSRTALTQVQADSDVQLSMYDLAVSILYPQYTTIVGAFDYLRLGQVASHRTVKQRESFIVLLDTVYNKILNTKKKDALPVLNTFCGWCDFKGFCPKYTELVTSKDLKHKPLAEMSDEEYMKEYSDLRFIKTLHRTRETDLKAEFSKRLNVANEVIGAGYKGYKTQSKKKSYTSKSVFDIVGSKEYLKMSTVTSGKVKDYIKSNPEHEEKLNEAAVVTFNAPTFRMKQEK